MGKKLILEILLVIVNSIALVAFGIDKFRSREGGWRIPESRLLLIAFVGPFGGFVGMLLFRHKIRKIKFALVPIFLIGQVLSLIYLYSNGIIFHSI